MKKAKKYLVPVLAILVAILVLSGFFGLTSNVKIDDDYVKVNPTYSVGGLTDYGKFDDVKDSLYTKEVFECKGIEVQLDFDADITYEIYFYDEDENFVSKTEELSSSYKDECPEEAVYARIVIHPTFDEDDKEPSISFIDRIYNNYKKQLTIKVLADQEPTEEVETE